MPPLRYPYAYPSPALSTRQAPPRAYSYGVSGSYGPFTAAANYSSTPKGVSSTSLNGSKSGGFIKSGARVKSRAKVSKVEKLGVLEVIETGGVVDGGAATASSGNTVVVGHCTMPSGTINLVMFRALVKMLFMKVCNSGYGRFDDTYIGQQLNDIIRLNLYINEEVGIKANLDVVVSAGVQTFEQIAANMAGQFRNYSGSDATARHPEQYVLKSIEFIPTQPGLLGFVFIDLSTASITIDAKSTLKFQNRSSNTTNGDEEAVDNVPLYGKSYQGSGNGTGAINRNSFYLNASHDFIANDRSGVIAKVPTETYYQEPIGPEMLEKVSSHGKVHLDPGHLKTSSLSTHITMPLQKFIRETAYKNDAAIAHHRHYKGAFRFMMLEKMLAANTGSATNSIKLGYEHNLRIGAYISAPKRTMTAHFGGS